MSLLIALFAYYMISAGVWNVERKDDEGCGAILFAYFTGWIALPVLKLERVLK